MKNVSQDFETYGAKRHVSQSWARSAPASRAIVLAVSVVLVALTGFYVARRFEARRSGELLHLRMADLNREIDRNLPAGSAQSEVISFLDAHGIDHSPFMPALIENGAAFTIQAQTRERISTPNYPCSIHIDFSFNKEQRMTSYSIEFSCYGP